MTQISSKTLKTFLAGLFAVVGLLGFQAGAVAASPVAPAQGPVAPAQWPVAPALGPVAPVQAPGPVQVAAQPECGDVSGFERVDLSALPPEATDTVELIRQGGPYPYPQDGTTFQNREGILPDCADGYYKEYTVDTPGSDDRGARRFVVGDGGEYFYTDDHYESFRLTDTNA